MDDGSRQRRILLTFARCSPPFFTCEIGAKYPEVHGEWGSWGPPEAVAPFYVPVDPYLGREMVADFRNHSLRG